MPFITVKLLHLSTSESLYNLNIIYWFSYTFYHMFENLFRQIYGLAKFDRFIDKNIFSFYILFGSVLSWKILFILIDSNSFNSSLYIKLDYKHLYWIFKSNYGIYWLFTPKIIN